MPQSHLASIDYPIQRVTLESSCDFSSEPGPHPGPERDRTLNRRVYPAFLVHECAETGRHGPPPDAPDDEAGPVGEPRSTGLAGAMVRFGLEPAPRAAGVAGTRRAGTWWSRHAVWLGGVGFALVAAGGISWVATIQARSRLPVETGASDPMPVPGARLATPQAFDAAIARALAGDAERSAVPQPKPELRRRPPVVAAPAATPATRRAPVENAPAAVAAPSGGETTPDPAPVRAAATAVLTAPPGPAPVATAAIQPPRRPAPEAPHPVAKPTVAPVPRAKPDEAALTVAFDLQFPTDRGGPLRLVPRRAAVTTAPAAEFRVQLAALRDEANATYVWHDYATAFGPLAAGLTRYDVPAGTRRGIFHLLQIGPLADLAHADAMCTQIKRHGHDCAVVQVQS